MNRTYNSQGNKFLSCFYEGWCGMLSEMRRIRFIVGNIMSELLSPGIIIRILRILRRRGPRGSFFTLVFRLRLRYQYRCYLLAQKNLEKGEEKKRERVSAIFYRPKVSILVPVYNTNEKWLRLCVESVLNQLYDNWELCIVDGCSKKPYIKKMLEQYATRDNRIKVNYLPLNKGIAGNTNEALALASGEFIGFLDHDDELAPDALYEVVKTLNEKKNIDFVYTDEDKISGSGKRSDPHFKPDWSPDALFSSNYITHFSVIKKNIVDRVGGFREGYDGSQDYDLFLRATEVTSKIAHVRKVLYHWRTTPQSAASTGTAKPYAYIAAKKALEDSLKRRNVKAVVEYGISAGYYKVQYELLNNPSVSIVIATKDNARALRRCIQAVLDKTHYDNYKILIVDNQSSEPEIFKFYKEVASQRKVKIAKFNGSFNYSRINNYAVSLVDSEYIIFLDVFSEIISQKWLITLLGHAQREDVGAVGALLYYPNNTIYHAGVIVGIGGTVGYSHRRFPKYAYGYMNRAGIVQNLSAVSGASLMTKKSVFEEIGGIDENYSHALADVDFCLEARRRGYLIIYSPYAELYYYGSVGRGYKKSSEHSEGLAKDISHFQRKWRDVLAQGDPYYNPNLTLDREDFSIKI